MPISFSCGCGQNYTVPDTMAGQQLRCPACEKVLVVPAATAVRGPGDDEAEEDTSTPYGFADEPGRHPAPAIDDEPEVVDDEPEVMDDEAVQAGDESDDPEYFVAATPAKTFRFYLSGDQLLMLHAGPFTSGLVGTLADRSGRRGKGPAGVGGRRTSADEAAHLALAKRAAVLDRMTMDELRAEADSDGHSLRVTADNTSRARIEPPATGPAADRKKRPSIVGRLTFTHTATAEWDLALVSPADARAAARAFRRVLGPENVVVTMRAT